MVNFHDPRLLFPEILALVKFYDAVCGVYIWEFVSNLHYEWGVIRGNHPHRWTIWIYVITRFATLMAVIMALVDFNIASPISSSGCQVVTSLGFTFAYMAFSFSSLLIVLRIIAIWSKNKLIVGLATGVWVITASILIHGLTQIRSSWDSEVINCSLPNVKSNRPAIISVLASDIVLLVIMFIGLLRLWHRGEDALGLVRLLWKQGVIYLLVVTAADIPAVAFICLDLNEAFDLMFLMPGLVTTSIATTRMYRSLIEGFSDNTKDLDGKRVDRTDLNAELTTTTPSVLNGMGVSVLSSYNQWQSSATQTDPYVSFIDIERQMGAKARRMSLDDYAESGMEK